MRGVTVSSERCDGLRWTATTLRHLTPFLPVFRHVILAFSVLQSRLLKAFNNCCLTRIGTLWRHSEMVNLGSDQLCNFCNLLTETHVLTMGLSFRTTFTSFFIPDHSDRSYSRDLFTALFLNVRIVPLVTESSALEMQQVPELKIQGTKIRYNPSSRT